jgi:hypothetical protein
MVFVSFHSCSIGFRCVFGRLSAGFMVCVSVGVLLCKKFCVLDHALAPKSLARVVPHLVVALEGLRFVFVEQGIVVHSYLHTRCTSIAVRASLAWPVLGRCWSAGRPVSPVPNGHGPRPVFVCSRFDSLALQMPPNLAAKVWPGGPGMIVGVHRIL